MFSAANNLSLERERQLDALLEWEIRVLRSTSLHRGYLLANRLTRAARQNAAIVIIESKTMRPITLG
ncbi:hypothetical protein [Methylomonas sp. MgM2]